ncbi:TPA: hypothetical protein DCZ16_00495 [Candidatus Peregrinibacteria bacterium]|nr:hypothetical protein [Candidatus Peregrinibacteria bacterium]
MTRLEVERVHDNVTFLRRRSLLERVMILPVKASINAIRRNVRDRSRQIFQCIGLSMIALGCLGFIEDRHVNEAVRFKGAVFKYENPQKDAFFEGYKIVDSRLTRDADGKLVVQITLIDGSRVMSHLSIDEIKTHIETDKFIDQLFN